MSDLIIIILLGLLTLATHFIEGISGFGATVLAMPFAIQLVGSKTAVLVLAVHSLILALFVIIKDFKNIVWREYIKIVACMGLGMPLGIWMFSYLPEGILKKILGAFMILISIRSLLAILHYRDNTKPINKWMLYFLLFIGGIIHGAFGTGGPLAIIYASRALKDKGHFRATMCSLWCTLNTVLIVTRLYKGDITPHVGTLMLYTIPFLVLGIAAGNFIHYKVKDSSFNKLVYILMGLSGIFMVAA